MQYYDWHMAYPKPQHLFKNKQLYWTDLIKKELELDCTHVDHNQLDTLYHLQSYTVYSNIVLATCGHTGTLWLYNQHNICIYDFKR